MTTLNHAGNSMMETSGRAVRHQPSIMRQHRVRINLVAALSHADPCDVPPILSSTSVWSPIPYPKEIGREEAFFRRTDHRLPARSRSGHSDQGLMPAAWLQ
ncbi:hypothetical protein FQK02_06690 [Xanthomonas vasicola]|nr:hypothetical protein FQK02_06690 [Xanthomonas vasicola]